MVFLDTNVLLRLADVSAPEHSSAVGAIEAFESRHVPLVIGTQVLAEAWVVATKPSSANGFGWPVPLTAKIVGEFADRFTVLLEDATTSKRWLTIVADSKVTNRRAHDARIVALMLTHGVRELLTFNGPDFRGLADIAIVHPTDVK